MNLKHFFYRKYYEKLDLNEVGKDEKSDWAEDANKKLYNFSFKNRGSALPLDSKVFSNSYPKGRFKRFHLCTLYPGLIIGTGYLHETKTKEEIKIGFHFDHTTGLPVLPGHSIKGVLRSVFPTFGKKDQLKEAKAEYISSLLGKNSEFSNDEKKLHWVQKLDEAIFEGKIREKGVKKSLPRRDVFFDAVICGTENKGGKIVGPDFLTPHAKPLKNPVPLPFLKVLPGVIWEFSFLLHDTEIDDIKISAQEKELLFKRILLEQGAGAKTNVGYGRFKLYNCKPPSEKHHGRW